MPTRVELHQRVVDLSHLPDTPENKKAYEQAVKDLAECHNGEATESIRSRLCEAPVVNVDGAIKPYHYRSNKVETIEVMEELAKKMANSGTFSPEQTMLISHVMKYLIRCPEKNGVEDLKKARNYLHRAIEGEWYE